MKRKPQIFRGIIVLAAMPAFVFGQQSMDTSATQQLNQVVVTAQFAPTDVRETVNSVRVLNSNVIQQRAANNLEELLQTEANIRLSQDAVLGSSLSVNGLQGENVKILVDGVPVIGRLNGSVDAGQLPLGSVQQVEIVEGAQSLLYGSDAAAGVINLVTRKSQVHRFEADVNSQLESNGYQNFQARTGLRIGKFLLQLSGNQLNFEPQTDTSQGRDQLWNPKSQRSGRALLRFTPNDKIDLRLTGSLFSEKVDNLGDMRRPTYKPYAFDDYYLSKRSDLSFQGEGKLKKGLYWQSSLAWNRFDRIKNSWRFDFENAKQTLIDGQQDTSASQGLLARFTLASNQKAKRLNFLLGLENYRETAEGLRILDSTATKPGMASGNEFAAFGSVKALFWNKLTLQGGARWTQNQLYGAAFTPSIWLMWRPASAWQLRLSYANGFRSPGLKELYFNFIDVNHFIVGNTELQPERSHNLRGEVNWQAPGSSRNFSFGLKACGFFNEVRDRIILAEIRATEYHYENLQHWETGGAGLGFDAQFRDVLSFHSNVVLTGYYNTFSEADATMRKLNWSPDWVNELNVRFFQQKVSFNVWHKMTGRTPYFYSTSGQIKQGESEGWNLLNASISGHFFNKRLCVNTGVKNILNVQQIRANASDSVHSSGTETQAVHWGRTYFVGVKLGLWGKN